MNSTVVSTRPVPNRLSGSWKCMIEPSTCDRPGTVRALAEISAEPSDTSDRRRLSRSAVNGLRISVSVGLLAVVAWRTDWETLSQAFSHLHAAGWLSALAVYLALQAVSGLRWQLLARPLGFRRTVRQF